ncbi:MAG: hypothetical protein WAV22_10980 [Porticoccaceae bacterium]
MDKNEPIKPSNPAADSLRNPLAALAETADHLAKNESHPKYRAQKRREASRLRELARQQPPPAQPPK